MQKNEKFRKNDSSSQIITGIPRFTLLMWGHLKNAESEKRINGGYLVVLKERKKGLNYKPC